MTRYLIIERDTRIYPVCYRVWGVERSWKQTDVTLLRTFKTFRGADQYRRRMLSTPICLIHEVAA